MPYYAGLDISLDMTSVCVVDGEGGILVEASVPTDPTDIAAFLASVTGAYERVTLEAMSLAYWIHDGLREAMSEVNERLAMLRQLARGPLRFDGRNKVLAKKLADAGLAHKIPDGALRGHHEITPQGRAYIVASAAAQRRRLEASAEARRQTGFAAIGASRPTIETAADMLATRWDVISRCESCSFSTAVDLDQLIWSKGSAIVLWDRREPYPCAGCHGEMRFLGRVPAGGGIQALTAAPD
jgi:hypothetical protein